MIVNVIATLVGDCGDQLGITFPWLALLNPTLAKELHSTVITVTLKHFVSENWSSVLQSVDE